MSGTGGRNEDGATPDSTDDQARLGAWWPERFNSHRPGQRRSSLTRAKSAEQAAWRIALAPPPPGRTATRQALAILTPLAEAGWTPRLAQRFAAAPSRPGTARIRNRVNRNPARGRRWLATLWRHASTVTVANRQPDTPEARRLHQRLVGSWWAVALAPAPGPTGETDRAVTLTLIAEQHAQASLTISIPAAAVALRAGLSPSSAARSLQRAAVPGARLPRGWPRVTKKRSGSVMGSNRYSMRVSRIAGWDENAICLLFSEESNFGAGQRYPNMQFVDCGSSSVGIGSGGNGTADSLNRATCGTSGPIPPVAGDPRSARSGRSVQILVPASLSGVAADGTLGGVLMGSVGHDCWRQGSPANGSLVRPGHVGHHLLCLLAVRPRSSRGELAGLSARQPERVSDTLRVLAEAGLVAVDRQRWSLESTDPATVRVGMDRLAGLVGAAGAGERDARLLSAAQDDHRHTVGSLARRHADERAVEHALSVLALNQMPWEVSASERADVAARLPGAVVDAAVAGLEATVTRRSVRAGEWDADDVEWVARRIVNRLDWPDGWEVTRDWGVDEAVRMARTELHG